MTPMTNTSSSPSTEMMRWNSPIPYLFGGLALILGLIIIALSVLACSYLYNRKQEAGSPDSSAHAAGQPSVVDDGPRVVVIMAGDDRPTYLAMPKTIVSLDSINPPLPPPSLAEDGDDGQV